MASRKRERALHALICLSAFLFSATVRGALNFLPAEEMCLDLGPREMLCWVEPVRAAPGRVLARIRDERGTENMVLRRYWITGQKDETFHEYRGGLLIRDETELEDGGWLVTMMEEGGRTVKLKADGEPDKTFNYPGSGWPKFVLGEAGKFYTLWRVGPSLTVARFNPNGTMDDSFPLPQIDQDIDSITSAGQGRIIVQGHFNTVNGAPRNRVALIRADGSVDVNFSPTASIHAWHVFGSEIFATIQPEGNAPRFVARLLDDGSVDPAFHSFGSLLYRDSAGRFYGSSTGRWERFLPNGESDPSYTRSCEMWSNAATEILPLNDEEVLVLDRYSYISGVDATCGRYRMSLVPFPTYYVARMRIAGEIKPRVASARENGNGEAMAFPIYAFEGTRSALVVRTGETNAAETFRYKVRGGSATAGRDLLATEGSFRFEIGEERKNIPIEIIEDNEPELSETFYVDFWTEAGEFVSTAQGVIRTSTQPSGELLLNGVQWLEDGKFRVPYGPGGWSWDVLSTSDFATWRTNALPVTWGERDGWSYPLIELDPLSQPGLFIQLKQRQ